MTDGGRNLTLKKGSLFLTTLIYIFEKFLKLNSDSSFTIFLFFENVFFSNCDTTITKQFTIYILNSCPGANVFGMCFKNIKKWKKGRNKKRVSTQCQFHINIVC
jgi:hypothetical protein